MKRPSKYGNQKTTVDNITFDSAAEAKRYGELKLLMRANPPIRSLELQPEFKFAIEGKRIFTYRADFAYYDENNSYVVEDVKGVRTPVYRLKKKIIEAIHGIEIREI